MFVDEHFINKAQFDAGFEHRLILKDGAVPAIKDPVMIQNCRRSVKRLQISVFCWRSALKCSSLFSSAHSAPPGALLFSERIVNLNLSFINMIKLKTFWRYDGCNTTL